MHRHLQKEMLSRHAVLEELETGEKMMDTAMQRQEGQKPRLEQNRQDLLTTKGKDRHGKELQSSGVGDWFYTDIERQQA